MKKLLTALLLSVLTAGTALAGTFSVSSIYDDVGPMTLKIAPGESMYTEFLLSNNDEEVKSFYLNLQHSTGELNAISNVPTMVHEDEPAKEVNLWGQLEEEIVSVGGNETAVVRLDFDIPADTPLGDYYGGVFARYYNEDTGSTAGSGVTSVVKMGKTILIQVVTEDEFKEFKEERYGVMDQVEEEMELNSERSYTKYVGALAIILIAAMIIAFTNKKD